METPSDNLYMTGLPENINEAALQELFSMYGQVVQCRVLPNPMPGGPGGGAALVRFQSVDEATAVLSQMNGMTPVGFDQPMQVKFAVNKKAGGGGGGYGKWQDSGQSNWSNGGGWGSGGGKSRSEPEPGDNLYIKGLPGGTDEAWLMEALSGLAVVTSVRILNNQTDETCAALVRFTSVEDATRIKDMLHGQSPEWCPSQLEVRYADRQGKGGGGKGGGGNSWSGGGNDGGNNWSKGGGGKGGGKQHVPQVPEDKVDAASLVRMVAEAEVLPGSGPQGVNPDATLYVGGLPEDTTNRHVYQLFAPFGAIVSVHTKYGNGWAIAFVNYVDPLSAQAAISVYNGMQVPDGSVLKVQIKGGKGGGAGNFGGMA